MGSLKNIISSFSVKKNLNPKFWYLDSHSKEMQMRPEIRSRLLSIANEFIEYLDMDIVVSDIIMTGSLANYNWSKFSDIDLHIVVDFEQFNDEEKPLYEELFTLKKTVYNDKHNFTIHNYDVELYVQDENESHFSSGVYSILYDEWDNQPKKEDVSIDKKLIRLKSQQWMNIIDGIIENSKDEDIDTVKELVKKYKDKLKKYRTCGLQKGGEYSDENLVFKVLRRNGYIEKLYNFQNKFIDKKLSLEENLSSNI